jgi:hypothetical protein
MLQNEIENLPKLKNDDYANIFNVYTDNNGYYYYNLLQGVNIPANLPDGYYDLYPVTYGDTWPFISYKAYKTPNMWWLVIAANNIQDPTKQPEPGSTIKILKLQYASLVLAEINSQNR